jgi:hypothetical protein
MLEDREVPGALTEVAVEAVRRGAIVVLVEAPNREAVTVARCLDEAGAVEPAALLAAWQANPRTTYGWAGVPQPVVDPPGPP